MLDRLFNSKSNSDVFNLVSMIIVAFAIIGATMCHVTQDVLIKDVIGLSICVCVISLVCWSVKHTKEHDTEFNNTPYKNN